MEVVVTLLLLLVVVVVVCCDGSGTRVLEEKKGENAAEGEGCLEREREREEGIRVRTDTVLNIFKALVNFYVRICMCANFACVCVYLFVYE